jgi:hypothetical protein
MNAPIGSLAACASTPEILRCPTECEERQEPSFPGVNMLLTLIWSARYSAG